jgi:AraC-like DNA-binding protein
VLESHASGILFTVKLDLPKEREFDAGIWYSTPASTWYPTHYHDALELKLVLWGNAVYDVGPCRTVLGPGSELWLAPGQEHTLVEVSDDLAMWVSSFREDPVRPAERESGARVLDQVPGWGACVLPPATLHQLSTLCSELVIRDEPRDFNPLSHRLLVGALDAWLEHGQTGRPLPLTSGGIHPAVVRAVALLRGPEGDMTLDQLARRCGLSAPRLSRLFKQQMGLSLVQYRSHYRVQHFITEFGRGDRQTMLEVALRVGFGSYPQFHRAFWQVTGYAPSEHLRRVRSGVVVPTEQGRQAKPSGGRV